MGTKAVICYPSNRISGVDSYDICLVKTPWDEESLECMIKTYWKDDDKLKKLMMLRNVDEFEETYEDTKSNQSKEILPGRYRDLKEEEVKTRMEELECGLLFCWNKEHEDFVKHIFQKYYVVYFDNLNNGIEKKWFENIKEAVDYVQHNQGIKPRYFKVEKDRHIEIILDLEPWKKTDLKEHIEFIIDIMEDTKGKYLTRNDLSSLTYYKKIKQMIKEIEQELEEWISKISEEVIY